MRNGMEYETEHGTDGMTKHALKTYYDLFGGHNIY